MINKTKNFIINNKKDLYSIILLLILLLIISVPKLTAQYSIGIGNWDTYLYLENGRNFAKMGWGDVPSISPVLPMILSKLFLLAGHPYQEAIFNVDVVFYIIGVIGFYLLLRLRYDEKTSLTGSILYATFTLLYSWVAIGGNDIIGVTGTVMTIYLLIVAHRYNNKLYYIALPVAAYAFLSRYTAGVMIFSIVFYWIISEISFDEIKKIILGGILGVISIGWFLYQFYIHLGTPFPFLGQFSGTVSNTVVLDSGYLPDSWYYIKHLTNYLSSYVPHVTTFNAIVNPMGNIPSVVSYVYIALFLSAFVLLTLHVYKNVRKNQFKGYKSLISSIVLFVLFIATLGNVSYIISNIIFLVALYILWNMLKNYEIINLDVDFVMFSLLVIYTVFQSILFTKNDRYFITVLPFIAYFITYTINWIYERMDKFNMNASTVMSVLIILLLIGNTLTFVSALPTDNAYNNIEESCKWLEDNEGVNNSTIVYSDNWPAVTWYLNVYCQRGVPNLTDIYYPAGFSQQLLPMNSSHRAASYYVDTNTKNKTDYPAMIKYKSFENVQIYKNRYLEEYGSSYLYTDEYNTRINKDIKRYNKSMGGS